MEWKTSDHIDMIKIKTFSFPSLSLRTEASWNMATLILTRHTQGEVLDSHCSSGCGSSCPCCNASSFGDSWRMNTPDRRDTYVGCFHLTCIFPSPNIRENWVIHMWELQRSLILSCLLHLLFHSHSLEERVILESAQGKFKLLPGQSIFAIGKDSFICNLA